MAEYIDKQAATAYAPLPKELREYQTANLDDAFEYGYDFAIGQIDAIPDADVRPVVLCRDCIYWQKPQIWQNDGTFRDYEPGEYERDSIFGGVSLEVGVNYGPFCALYDRNHENKIPQFMGENDFCSKGYKREES